MSKPRDWLLTRPERELLAAAADAFFPPGGPIPLSGSEANVVRYFDDYVRRAQPTQAFLMRLLFAFMELGPLPFGPRMRRFSRLSLDERIRFLDGARDSRIYFRRVSFISLRALMTMAYLSHPEVARSMGMFDDTDPFDLGGERGAEPVDHRARAEVMA